MNNEKSRRPSALTRSASRERERERERERDKEITIIFEQDQCAITIVSRISWFQDSELKKTHRFRKRGPK